MTKSEGGQATKRKRPATKEQNKLEDRGGWEGGTVAREYQM